MPSATPPLPTAADALATPAWPSRCRTGAAWSAAVLLSACASTAGVAPTAQMISPAAAGLSTSAPGAPGAPGAPMPGAAWWRAWDDPALTQLVEQALAGQPSLAVAQARLRQAAAAASGARAAEGLQVSGEADATRQRFSGASIYPPPLGGSIRSLANVQLGAQWSFDFFGRDRAAIESAVGAQRAAEADVQAARAVLVSQVATGYVQLGRLFEQRRVAEQTLRQREAILHLVRQRVGAGLDSVLEQRRGEGALPDSRLQLAQIDEQILLQRHRLATLAGQAPAALDGLVVTLAPLQRGALAAALPAALPAGLLGRRAEVRAARWRIEAAAGQVRGARAAFYPNVNLNAFVGLSSLGLDRLLRSGSEQYGVGPALSLPIFDAGRLRANLSARAAELDAAVESYNGAVRQAVQDVLDQLGSLQALAAQQHEQDQAQAAAESAYDTALQRYRAGLTGYLSVLDAESAVLSQRRQAVDLRARWLETRIALTRALGGGDAADVMARGGDAADVMARGDAAAVTAGPALHSEFEPWRRA